MKLPNLLEAKKRTNKKTDYLDYNNNPSLFGLNKKYYLKTYGCQMNEHDSERFTP